ncbi:hypothetical protein [Ascidiaceihabitans sp.]|uniref:hypothetical protein n=1 Tax=Ascidiaceihabitans sp. TaxID=1872644 RepID=UPI0032995C55
MVTSILAGLSLHDYRLNAAIRVGNVWLPSETLSKHLVRFAQPLLLSSGDQEFPYGINGSATFVRFQSNYYAIITRHQLKDNSASSIGFRANSDHKFVLGGTFYFSDSFEKDRGSHADELVFIDLGVSVSKGSLNEFDFFDISEENCAQDGDDVVFGLAYGYPHDVQEFDFDETGNYNFRMLHVGTVVREIISEYAGETFDQTICGWNIKRSEDYEVSGISGGPAFCVKKDADGFRLKLAGVITTGSASKLNTIKVQSIKRYLRAIAKPN